MIVPANSQTAIQTPSKRAGLVAGAATSEITPGDRQFLYGYPMVPRFSTGVHDPLLSSALYLADGTTRVMFVANDLIYLSMETVARVRARIESLTSVPAGNILVSVSHTHSGPMTLDLLVAEGDPVIPKTDPKYVQFIENKIVESAVEAVRGARPAAIGLAVADGTGVGTNRRDPAGPANPEVPVLMVRSRPAGDLIACMVVCSMHPTVLHEDSTLVSADFPGMTRQYLQREVVGLDCTFLYHMGPAGNQSPRYSVSANTFAEAERLGQKLGAAIAAAIPDVQYREQVQIVCTRDFVELPRRSFSSVQEATETLAAAARRLAQLRRSGAPRQQIRTAEVDWFGAGENLTLARAAADHRLDSVVRSCLPAEIQIIALGPWTFVGWPGEIFVEYGLAVKAHSPDTHLISLANGELQGYIVTAEAVAERAYEAGNALFDASSGTLLVERTLKLISSSSF